MLQIVLASVHEDVVHTDQFAYTVEIYHGNVLSIELKCEF